MEQSEKKKKKRRNKNKKVQNLVLNNNKLLYEYFEFFHDKEQIVVEILSKIYLFYEGLINSSQIIQDIFSSCFKVINKDYKISLNVEQIHKEEFINAIKSEDFLNVKLKFKSSF